VEHSRGSGDGQPVGLTPYEAEVLRLYATGMSSEEVAGNLGTTADAVRGHLTSAMGKLGARTKLKAILAAIRSGQIRL
jgi:DNA-binding CsgD family transcriptional regulator